MAGTDDARLDLEGDSSGDFVLPNRIGVRRKKMPSPVHGGKSRKKEVDVDAGGLKLNSSFSVNKIRNVLDSFVGQKKQLLDSIGFGGLLLMHKQPRISRRLAFWLLRNMDTASSSIVLRDGVKLHVNDADVNLVLGLPHHMDSARRQQVSISRAAELVKINLGLGKHADIRMDYIESLLLKDYCGKMSTKEKLAFKVALVLFLDAYFLAPKSSTARVNHCLLPYLVDPDAIQQVNWSAYVLKAVKEASLKVKHVVSTGKKCVSLDCCLIFLEVFYLDNLDTASNGANHRNLPRVSDFPYEKIKHIISEDMETSTDGKTIFFGKLKVKPSDQVVYCWGTSNISSSHPRTEATKEDPGKYVMSRFMEFKEQLDEYRRAYVDQIEALFLNLEYSMTEYLSASCTSENRGVAQDCIELTVSCVEADGDRYCMNPNSPISNSETRQSPSLGICQEFEAIDLCSPEVNLLKPPGISMSPAIRSYGLDSAGPAFDQSAVRESGERCNSFHGSSILRSTHLEDEEEHVVSCRAEILPKQYPRSPFMVMLEDQVIPKRAVLSLQQELEQMGEEDLERYWFVHKTPTPISLSGRRLREEFTCTAEWTVSVVDAISRLLMHLDDIMYDGQTEKRWRHFLPSSWSEIILHGPEARWAQDTEMMFRGCNIKYAVADCRMICSPVLVESSWSCYIWDFQENVLTVIDPKRMVHDKDYVKFKHQFTVDKLNRGLASCLGAAEYDWPTNYLAVQGANCESWYSGLYCMFYSRVFDGRCLTQLIPRVSSRHIDSILS